MNDKQTLMLIINSLMFDFGSNATLSEIMAKLRGEEWTK